MGFKEALGKELFHALNANVELHTIDMKTMSGRAVLAQKLAEYMDGVNEMYSQRAGRRLYDRLREILIRSKW
jgi:hypothetical protein